MTDGGNTITWQQWEGAQRALDAAPDLDESPTCCMCKHVQAHRRPHFTCPKCGVSQRLFRTTVEIPTISELES